MAAPAAELEIDAAVVRRLLVEQQPDLADLPMHVVANGWDNVVVRLGPDLMVRLPRRQASAQLVLNEQRWLPEQHSDCRCRFPHHSSPAGRVASIPGMEHLPVAPW